jgi:hypothetical protein
MVNPSDDRSSSEAPSHVSTARARLMRAFLNTGVAIDDGVEAFQGASPRWHTPNRGFGQFLVKRRALTIRDSHPALWVVYSGFVPGRKVAELSIADFAFDEGRRFDRITCGGVKFWIRARDRTVVQTWLKG